MYTLAIRQPDLKTDFTFTEIICRFLLNSILKLSLIEKHPVWILGWSSISVLKVQWNKRTRWLKRSTKFSLESYALLYQGQLRGKSRSFFQVTDVTVLHKWNPYRRLSAGANPEGQFGHVRRCANSKKKHERERHVVLEHFTPTLCGKCTRFCSTFLTFTVTHAPNSSGLLSGCLRFIDIFLQTAWCNDELPWCLAHVLMLRANTFA